ncbi:MAG: hypothetical protein IE885_06495 [Campylobacterales bacterium]|nr:hypothetical protein [Campylobacterales bacterium]
MKIDFDKIGATPKHFKIELDGATLEGDLQKSGHHRIMLDGRVSGEVTLECDRCGSEYLHQLDTSLKLTIGDQMIEDKEDLDIIEFLDGMVDLSYILESEINALKGAYHYCDICSQSDEDFEVEF